MTVFSPLTYGPVSVNWLSDGNVLSITYDKKPLNTAIQERLKSFQLGPAGIKLPEEFLDLVDRLLNSLAILTPSETRRKIFLADKIFEHLGVEFTPPNPKLTSMYWRVVLEYVWKWEDSHEKIHKGTAYYFMGKPYLGSGDVPSAYICFFNALEEDKRSYPQIPKNLKDAPTYLTTSLVDNKNNHLYSDVVVPLRTSLQMHIDEYRARTNRSLTMQELDRKFLQEDRLEDIKRFFVATFHEIYHLAPINSSRMINNDYSKLKIIDTLFNLGLIVDQLLEYRFLQSANREDKKMANALYKLALHLTWTSTNRCGHYRQLPNLVSPNLNSDSPDNIVPDILDGSARFDGQTINSTMRAMFLAYHLRNFAGHHVEGQEVLVKRYHEVLQGVMDAVFLAVEVL